MRLSRASCEMEAPLVVYKAQLVYASAYGYKFWTVYVLVLGHR